MFVQCVCVCVCVCVCCMLYVCLFCCVWFVSVHSDSDVLYQPACLNGCMYMPMYMYTCTMRM